MTERTRWSGGEWWLLAAVLLLFARAAWVNERDLREFPGIDLRNRVVGARSFLAGHSPYTYRWQKGDPIELADPVHDPLHRFTISPAELAFYLPSASLSYGTQRWLHAFFEWSALVGALILLMAWLESRSMRLCFLLLVGCFFVNGDIWRFHVERGQVYVFHLFLLTLCFRWLDQDRLNSVRAGCLLGLLMLFRPTFVVVIPPLLLMRRWRTISGIGFMLAAGVVSTAVLMPNASWKEYLGMGEAWFRVHAQPNEPPLKDGPPENEMPALVEGYVFAHHLRGIQPDSLANIFWLANLVGGVPVFDWGLVSKIALIVVVLALYANLWLTRPAPQRATLALLACLLLGTELFLPMRWPYVDVQLLLPLALCFPWLRQSRFLAVLLMLALAVTWLPVYSANMNVLEQYPVFFYLAPVPRPWILLAGLSVLAGKACRAA